MSIALLFRNRAAPNLFRNSLLAATTIPNATEIIICSGFFQSKFNGSPYNAAHEGGLATKLKSSGAHVITIGVHNYSWYHAFKNFNSALMAAGVHLTSKYIKGCHWHAKILMVSTARGPVLSAIGSSNMTRNAFSDSMPFNYEADVVLWVPQARGVSSLVNGVLRESNAADVVRAPYSTARNSRITVRQRLTQLRQEVLGSAGLQNLI